jgi:hypothetical protein
MPSTVNTILSAFTEHHVQYLLMGGQACILYGGAEFSRDTDLAIVAETANLGNVTAALLSLRATIVAVPPYDVRYLEAGHAIRFICAAAENARVDLMARMRNVAPFRECWTRRSTVELSSVGEVNVMGLADLVACKKTQREKDWPMITRLVDVNYASSLDGDLEATPERCQFWLRELRTTEFLIDCVRRYPVAAQEVARMRGATAAAVQSVVHGAPTEPIEEELDSERRHERRADAAYWAPLMRELEALRHAVARGQLEMGWPPPAL